MSKKVIVIGSGFSGLSAACYLAKAGFEVTILEKNNSLGGRARTFNAEGFTFDMGPSWYWMPDVFERFFDDFGKKVADFYELVRLNPSYSVFFGKDDILQVPAKMDELEKMFEQLEAGSSKQLKSFLEESAYKYKVGMEEFVHKPSHSIWEFVDLRILKSAIGLQLFTSMSKYLRSFFKNEKLLQLLEFPVLFLGATPQNTPALYSLMNYADIKLGTWYPLGGMHKIVEGMVSVAKDLGVKFQTDCEVVKIEVANGITTGVHTSNGTFHPTDILVGSADYQHIESKLLNNETRNYSNKYWDKRVMAPSSLLFYLGVNKRLVNLKHHNLFFDEDFGLHAHEIYTDPKWPSKPLFYVSVPSITDASVAPDGCENVFILIPAAPDLEDTDEVREKYFNIVIDRLEKLTGQKIRESIIYKRSFAHRDFKSDYHAFKGNAYGLANTLLQTAFLKPKLRNKNIKNFYYTGQLTTPGPGVPPSLISGEVVAKEIQKRSL
jgi:phytoene desaturase